MPVSSKAATTLYLATALVALFIALLCIFFAFIIGGGWPYLLPCLIATILIAAGMLSRPANPLLSAKLSGAGAILCTLPLLVVLVQSIYFTAKQPQFAAACAITLLLLLLLAIHPYLLIANYKDRHISR